ncbi:hypothetical protein FB567DRAFT_124633 [Paraphoma chrysanthemicola]|uniref:4Fe-4S ferredoxin-type domain-containing protein n=1 Tax=Paraphoma chrysanthemicola TaxID=798071 RepID=A0A8K0QZF9_9PLEO|nr:hypothetical protein FB567DRAFT_124633 [Paraphoma chrysanthemicola]
MAAIIPSLLPILASTMGAPTPECVALSEASNLLRIGDEGLRYCSSILSIGTVVDPVYSTVTNLLTTTISEITLTDTTLLTDILSQGTSYLTAPAVTETQTIVVPTTAFACPAPPGGGDAAAPAPEGRRGLNQIFNHPKVTSTDYPQSTEAWQEPSWKSRSKWLHLPSNVDDAKPSSKFHHHSSSTSKHISSPSPTLSHVIESRTSSTASSLSSKIDVSSDSASPSSPSPPPSPSMATPSPTPSSSLELSSDSSSLVITPTPSSSASPTPTPGPSCSTAPAAVVYLACDLVSTACSCLSLTSATITSTVTSNSIVSSILDTLNTIVITVQDITTITVPAVFDTTTPTVTATTASISTTTVCPCAAPRPSLCGTTAEECANLQDDADNCGTCGNVCPNGAGCNDGLCNQFRFMPRIR